MYEILAAFHLELSQWSRSKERREVHGTNVRQVMKVSQLVLAINSRGGMGGVRRTLFVAPPEVKKVIPVNKVIFYPLQ